MNWNAQTAWKQGDKNPARSPEVLDFDSSLWFGGLFGVRKGVFFLTLNRLPFRTENFGRRLVWKPFGKSSN
jgi:hypothetical protein